VAVVGATVVNYVPRRQLEYSTDEAPSGQPVFSNWFALIGATAVWVGLATYLDEELTIPAWGMDLLFLPTVVLIIVGVAFFPFQYGSLKRGVLPEPADANSEESSLLDKEKEKSRAQQAARLSEGGKEDCEFSLFEMLCTVEFWLLFVIFILGSGTCLTLLNNIAKLIDVFKPDEGTAVPLMLFGVCETAGRLSVSLSDVFRSRVARIFLLDAVLVLLFACCVMLAYANVVTLNICVILISYSYGFLYADISAIIADLFGVRHFGGNLGFSLFAPIIGSFAFASGLVDIFYKEVRACFAARDAI
jgi:hypothetical protein